LNQKINLELDKDEKIVFDGVVKKINLFDALMLLIEL
jgi:hypothetical protein